MQIQLLNIRLPQVSQQRMAKTSMITRKFGTFENSVSDYYSKECIGKLINHKYKMNKYKEKMNALPLTGLKFKVCN
jgi:hypothetical protein